jgi:2-dehydropantoate 2-reductase
MRFVIYGAGAIGGVLGGRLFEAGSDVTLVARGAHLAALRERGLTIVSPAGTAVLPVPVVGSIAEAAPADGDVVVLAMKSQDTPDAVRSLAAVAPAGVRVVCAQNGVENERVALRSFADVYGVTVICPSTHTEPGTVVAHASPTTGILDVGRYPSGSDATAEELAGAFRAATYASEARADVMRWKYAKLLDNLVNAVDAVCGERPGDDGAGPEVRDLVARVRAEGEAVLAAAGVDVVPLAELRARRAGTLVIPPIPGVGERTSTWQSLARGAGSVETDHLTGEVVLLGRLHGVPTPANTLLQSLATTMAATGAAPGAVPAAEVLARLG